MRRSVGPALIACTVACVLSGEAQAVLVTSATDLAPATVIDFQQFTTLSFPNAVPVQVGATVGQDVEMFGLGAADARVGPINHSLGGNGQWLSSSDPNFLSAYLPVSSSTAMEFVFNDGPVRGVGGFMNYTPGYGALIEVFDSGGVLLESYDLTTAAPISTPGAINEGAFRGIMRGSADISSFRYTGSWVTLDDLTFTRVPEPASLSLLGLGGLAALRRRAHK